ncbi:MAG: DNA topoisomerase IB [Nitrospira sp.]|nr:DNA topoisomerase IB [Nitrospira sp.]
MTVTTLDSNRSLAESVRSARVAGLRYVLDLTPGIARERRGRRSYYVRPNGTVIRQQACLRRIQSLVIPPAWTDIWICLDPHGHLQATGRDARGRKQYRYHPRWNHVRNETKYHRMLTFGRLLPRIRRRVAADLRRPGLPRDKILATVVRLLEATLIRIGNEEYARTNESFGLTTLRDRHVTVKGSTLRFEFRGKSGVRHNVDITDRRLARIVKQSRDLPGYELFQYIDEQGARHCITSNDVNAYLQQIAGEDFTAKDFRTWAGTVLAARALREYEHQCDSLAKAKRNVAAAIGVVAMQLGNTKAVCRKCYVHPEILEAYFDGTLFQSLRRPIRQASPRPVRHLPPEEAAILLLLRERILHPISRPA